MADRRDHPAVHLAEVAEVAGVGSRPRNHAAVEPAKWESWLRKGSYVDYLPDSRSRLCLILAAYRC